ncbi:MAG: YncE family protein [Proteobacteria bacterium]|nr:YncE family protein [Pseudomonadota bacterium]
MRLLAGALAATLLVGCPSWTPQDLEPYPNPFGEGDAGWAPQPDRENPLEAVASIDGARAWVSLQGSPDVPGRFVAEVDLETGELVRKIEVGSGATGLALHPGGRHLVVFNRFSNYASVIDTTTGRTSRPIPADYYGIEGVFTPDGSELWVTNRWRDAVQVWTVTTAGARLEVSERLEPGIPVGTNPRDIAISADGATVAVAALTEGSVSLLDVATRQERARVDLGAPANGLAFVGDWLVVATTSRSTHHQALAGPDTDGDGVPGDGTPNINFQDLQNELAVIDVAAGVEAARYTSDTICCKDYRDVDPDDGERLGDMLPPEETWIVGGALPEQVLADGTSVWVSYSGSNQVQRFEVDPDDGTLTARLVHEAAGHSPHGLAVTDDRLLVVHRLGETLGVRSSSTGELQAVVEVGDLSGGPFPATDAEIGELFNFVTSSFTVDGDQTCHHCHREGGNLNKAFSMPLSQAVGVGLRQTMDYRGAADTRPWFFEAAMDESNFVPVMNEFARIENFCCSDYTLFPSGAPTGCSANPPPECTSEPNPYSVDGSAPTRDHGAEHASDRPTAHASRDGFYTAQMETLIGRSESFGDGLYFEDPISDERLPIPLDFDGITRALGLFLLQDTHLLPNPWDPDREAAQRGRALFEGHDTACAACHPAPTFSTAALMGPVVTPFRADDGTNLDLLAGGFLDLFPRAEMDRCEDVCDPDACAADASVCDDLLHVQMGVTSLRGIWDRADSFLHHGRARGLTEVLATPGHPALGPGEVGFNERDGIPDTHGGTSHLSASELEDLATYLRTL